MQNSETGLLKIRQDVIIDRVIEELGLENGLAKVKCTPYEAKPLAKDRIVCKCLVNLFKVALLKLFCTFMLILAWTLRMQ